VNKLKELGVTLAIIHFYKGFGLAAERPHINDAIRLAALCHRSDIKVGVYVGSTVAYETFLLEKPEAEEWFVPDYMGKPVTYGRQVWRKRVHASGISGVHQTRLEDCSGRGESRPYPL
jgi:hypothetical protein